MIRRLRVRPVLVVLALLTVAFYQNCSQDPTTTNDTDGTSSTQSDLPFAYHATVDTMAYMSCSDMTDPSYNPRAYFTFRAGAYNNTTGGLSMTQNFYTSTQYYSNTARGNALGASDINSNILLNFSVRGTSDLQQPYVTTGSSGPGLEIDAFLPPLDSAQIAGPFASTAVGQMVNYFPGNEDQRLMEASIRFLTYENISEDLRAQIGSGSLIVLAGYSSTSDILDYTVRSPLDQTNSSIVQPANATNASYVYGTGYQMSFDFPARAPGGGDTRVLSTQGIAEWDYSTYPRAQIPATWSCPAAYQFMIVRPEDHAVNPALCNAGIDSYANTTQQSELAAIRRVLRVEDWYVDVVNNCVMPKNTGDYCYGSTLGTRTIQYDVATCSSVVTGPTECPHYVSVCIRQ